MMKTKMMMMMIVLTVAAGAGLMITDGLGQTTPPGGSGGSSGTVQVQNPGVIQGQTTVPAGVQVQRREQLSPAVQERIQAQQAGRTAAPTASGQFTATNGFAGTGTNSGFRTNTPGWSPTGNVDATNRMYGSNWNSANGSVSNRMTSAFQDTALTATDRSLLAQVRQTVITRLQPVGAWSPAAVHFQVNNGIVTLLGTVTTVQVSQQIEMTATQVPGIVRVVNRLVVNNG
jgi:osmotically-inducible protein OsmY